MESGKIELDEPTKQLIKEFHVSESEIENSFTFRIEWKSKYVSQSSYHFLRCIRLFPPLLFFCSPLNTNS